MAEHNDTLSLTTTSLNNAARIAQTWDFHNLEENVPPIEVYREAVVDFLQTLVDDILEDFGDYVGVDRGIGYPGRFNKSLNHRIRMLREKKTVQEVTERGSDITEKYADIGKSLDEEA